MANPKIKHLGIFFITIYDRLCDGCYGVASWMMLGIALIITYEILVRYFFNCPTIWVADFTDYIMLYSTFFVGALLLKREGHVRLTVVYEHLSPRSR
jgi:TRAP-type C4-dicarboxylate transport system permease small subunit